jgi:hypothetical protein
MCMCRVRLYWCEHVFNEMYQGHMDYSNVRFGSVPGSIRALTLQFLLALAGAYIHNIMGRGIAQLARRNTGRVRTARAVKVMM